MKRINQLFHGYDINASRSSRGLKARLLISCCATMLAAAPAVADVITLHSGGQIEGDIVEASGNIISVQRSIGGIQQVASQQIAEISLTLVDGSTVKGEFVKWVNGVQHIKSDGQILQLRAGELLNIGDEPAETATAETKNLDMVASAKTGSEPTRQSYVPPPIYVLSNGNTLVGRPVDFTGSYLTIRRASGGEQTVRVDDLQEVVVRGVDGRSIAGEFLGWAEGIFELRADNRLMRVQGGEVINEGAHDRQIGGPLEDVPPPEEMRFPTEKAIEITVAPIQLSATAELANERDEAIVFTLKLSKPAPQSIAIIYSMVAGTASKDDYQGANGVLTMKAGVETSQITVPLINDTIKEDDETVRLYLAADPSLVNVTANQVVATIRDDD